MNWLVPVAACLSAAWPAPTRECRPIPETTSAIHVWNDQLPDDMTPAQRAFVARHVDGTQKVSRQTATQLRAVNERFLVLHYRLAIGDGPVPFRIGERWASDYASVRRHNSWFWHEAGRRVLARPWSWYLMNPASEWRRYWAARVLHEAELLGDEGVFADSLGTPQRLGAESFAPRVRAGTEAAWTRRIDAFMRDVRRRLGGRLWFIANAGSWRSPRDRVDYTIPDGVMVEGFASPGAGAYYPEHEWCTQMDRVLLLARRGHIVIAQSRVVPRDRRARMFDLASHLLTKGRYSFVNFISGIRAQWFPEYDIALGAPLDPPAASIAALRSPAGVYVRRYRGGVVAVNPGRVARSYAFSGGRRLVEPHGGGALPPDASVPAWRLSTRSVQRAITLPAHGGAVLLG